MDIYVYIYKSFVIIKLAYRLYIYSLRRRMLLIMCMYKKINLYKYKNIHPFSGNFNILYGKCIEEKNKLRKK